MRGPLFVLLLLGACGGGRGSNLLPPTGDANFATIGTLRGAISFTDSTVLPLLALVTRDNVSGSITLTAKEPTVGVTVLFGWDGSLPLAPGAYYYSTSGGTVFRDDGGIAIEFSYPDSKQPQDIVNAMPTTASATVDHSVAPHYTGSLDAQTDAARLQATFDVTLPVLF